MELSTLNCLLASHFATKHTYKGFLLSLKTLKTIIEHELYGTYCLLINQHFMLFTLKRHSAILLDSLAQYNIHSHIQAILPKNIVLDHLDLPIQGSQSKACAYFVLFFAVQLAQKNYLLADIVKKFHFKILPKSTQYSLGNDYLVHEFVCKTCFPTESQSVLGRTG